LFRIAEDKAAQRVTITQNLVAQAPAGERARREVELQQAEVDDVLAP